MSLIHFLILLQIFWTFTEAKSNCNTGFCQTYPFDVYGDAVQEKELVGHVFHNSVTSSPVQCYLLCKDDCRCLSFNYKEMNDAKYCELNDASHFTLDSFLKRSAGSRYYNMRRFFHQKVSENTRIVVAFPNTFLKCNLKNVAWWIKSIS